MENPIDDLLGQLASCLQSLKVISHAISEVERSDLDLAVTPTLSQAQLILDALHDHIFAPPLPPPTSNPSQNVH